MRRAAKAAQTGGGAQVAPLRLFAMQQFDVWHREQLITVSAGEVRDTALVATLRSIHDKTLVEWRV